MLDHFHKVSEIVAAFAIVGSLIFVGVQVNQNTDALRNSAAQANADSWQNITLSMANNPKLAETWIEYVNFPEASNVQPTPELLQISSYIGANIKSMEANFLQWRSGNLSDELFYAARRGLVFQLEVQPLMETFVSGPGMTAYTPSFLEFLQEAMAEAKANRASRKTSKG